MDPLFVEMAWNFKKIFPENHSFMTFITLTVWINLFEAVYNIQMPLVVNIFLRLSIASHPIDYNNVAWLVLRRRMIEVHGFHEYRSEQWVMKTKRSKIKSGWWMESK